MDDKMKKIGIYFIDGQSVGMGHAYVDKQSLDNLLSGNRKKFLKYERASNQAPWEKWDEMETITTYVNPKYIVDVWVYDDFEVEE